MESLSMDRSVGATVQVGLQTSYKPASFSEFWTGTSNVRLRRASERAARRSEDSLRKESEEVLVKLNLNADTSNEAKGESR